MNIENSCLINILPRDGVGIYYGTIFSTDLAQHYLELLLKNIEWQHDEAIIYGKHIKTKRKVAWYGDQPFKYTYSKVTRQALPWNNQLLLLKSIVEKQTNENFNSCLLNLYHNGMEGMAWHSDEEKDLRKDGAIASLSFGATRKFSFRHKYTREKISLELESGSLFVMAGTTQTFWQHSLPITKRVENLRINLTFRTIASK